MENKHKHKKENKKVIFAYSPRLYLNFLSLGAYAPSYLTSLNQTYLLYFSETVMRHASPQ